MSEDDSALLLPNQLVGRDQPIRGVIHRGQLALIRLEQNQTWPDRCAVIRAVAKGSQSVEYRKHLNGNTVLYHNWPLAGGRRGFSASKQRTVTLEHAGKADAAILHAAFGE
jgi:hypothetical protein